MRSTVLATLILAPALAHAQASTQATGSLQARAEAPHSLLASAAPASSAADATTSKTAIRVSTGVIQPKLIGSPRIMLNDKEFDRQIPAEQKIVVGLLVDQNGNAQDVTVEKSLNKVVDERVIAAVRNFHFVPAQLDAQAIPVHVNLSIILQP